MKLTPTRMDIASRKTYPKDRLLRFVVIDGTLLLDEKHVLPGRGCYLLKSKEALATAVKKNLFTRHLHASPSNELLQRLEELL